MPSNANNGCCSLLQKAIANRNRANSSSSSDDSSSCSDSELSAMPSLDRPILACELLRNQHGLIEGGSFTETLREMLNATRSLESGFSLLRNHEDTLVRNIYEYIAFPKLAKHVKLTIPAASICQGQRGYDQVGLQIDSDVQARQELRRGLPEVSLESFEQAYVSHASLGYVAFPEPTGRNVNMMPFIFDDIGSLPDDLKCYYPLIQQCQNVLNLRERIAYLTVEETFVEAGATQRRPGLHIEAPGVSGTHKAACRPGVERHWGMGYYVGRDAFRGGIYFASSVGGTSQVFDALVDKTVTGICDEHGGCENLRRFMGKGKVLDANELVWMTDQTPHEPLPQPKPGYRQFFRLVMPEISHWYAKHSTPNPNVSLPDHVVVVHENKFETSAPQR